MNDIDIETAVMWLAIGIAGYILVNVLKLVL